jgi:hypothetical protein
MDQVNRILILNDEQCSPSSPRVDHRGGSSTPRTKAARPATFTLDSGAENARGVRLRPFILAQRVARKRLGLVQHGRHDLDARLTRPRYVDALRRPAHCLKSSDGLLFSAASSGKTAAIPILRPCAKLNAQNRRLRNSRTCPASHGRVIAASASASTGNIGMPSSDAASPSSAPLMGRYQPIARAAAAPRSLRKAGPRLGGPERIPGCIL